MQTDYDWRGTAVANDARDGKGLRARLQQQGLIPAGHIVAKIFVTFRSEAAEPGRRPPFVDVLLFDATGHRDPVVAFNEAKASGNMNLKTLTIAPARDDLLDLFQDFVVELSPLGVEFGDADWSTA